MFNASPFAFTTRASLILIFLFVCLLVHSSARSHSVSLNEKLMHETILSGDVLTEQPSELHVSFEMPIRIISIRLTHVSGEDIDVVSKSGRALTKMLVIVPPPLKNGKYTLEWRGLSKDGHSLLEKREFEVNIDS